MTATTGTIGKPRTIIDVHIIQTVPPSNLNRDDSGSPKTAVFGGVRRARVSSQAWKRAIRKDFAETLDISKIGVRTKRLVEMVAESIRAADSAIGEDESLDMAETVLRAAGLSVKAPTKPRKTASNKTIVEAEALAFLSLAQVDALTELALAARREGTVVDKKTAAAEADRNHSIDIALFGRMVAGATNLQIDAACQFAHALSTHAVSNEFDYYTAVDDRKSIEESAGAGMVGVVEFNSSTVYRFASLDVDRLADTLGDASAASAAVSTFLRSMVTAMPGGKMATFGNRTLPDAVVVSLRTDQPVSYVGAFEDAIVSESGRVTKSVEALAHYASEISDSYDSAPEQSWVVGRESVVTSLAATGEHLPLPEVVSAVGEVVLQRLSAE